MDAGRVARRAAWFVDDEIVWSWRPWAGAKSARRVAGDGDYEFTDTGESTKISVNTVAQGRPDCFGGPVVTNSYAFFHCIRGCGCAKHPVFPAPSVFERDKDDAKLGRKCAARMQSCVSDLFAAHPSRRRAKAAASQDEVGRHGQYLTLMVRRSAAPPRTMRPGAKGDSPCAPSTLGRCS